MEPFSAPLNTIVPLGGDTSSAGGGGGEDSDYGEEEEDSDGGVHSVQHGDSGGEKPHGEEVEDFAPISLNVRSVLVVLGALFKNFQSFVFKPEEENSVADLEM